MQLQNMPKANNTISLIKVVNGKSLFMILVLKKGILDQLTTADCEMLMSSLLTAVLRDILAIKPDGLFLSNGPGNPEVMNVKRF